MAVVALVILRRYRSYLEEANEAAAEDERLNGLPKVSDISREEPVRGTARVLGSSVGWHCSVEPRKALREANMRPQVPVLDSKGTNSPRKRSLESACRGLQVR
ncbi:hypothetical protein PAXINDRAFT_22238 [Paxillus involutus ATCC 200175]|uniref:Uncharacterized protein n=1 Tax=Paxillus involutus ATCC 200175 TaxID=664439 RepID=A0A0C9T890_PAXIN|nr:hypothetical protein PAXINDRAFT_22238 [Paxillus involutus ATCC 200175]